MFRPIVKITDLMKEGSRLKKKIRKTQNKVSRLHERLEINSQKIREAENDYRETIEYSIRSQMKHEAANSISIPVPKANATNPTIVSDDDLPY